MKGKMRRAGLAAAAALTLSIAFAPGFALADSGHHGQGYGHGNGQQEHGNGHKEHDHGDHGEKMGLQVRVQGTIAALNKAAAYYNPLIQADEQKVQAALTAAIQTSAAAGAQTAPVNTSADVTIEQQIQAAVNQMSSAQTRQQLLSLIAQVRDLSAKLQEQVKQSSQRQQDDHGKGNDHGDAAFGWMNAILHAFGLGKIEIGSSGADSAQSLQQMQAKLQAAEGRYAALYARVETDLQSGANGRVTTEGERVLWSLLHSYAQASAQLLHGLMRIDGYLSSQASTGTPTGTPGTPTTPPSSQNGGGSTTTPSGTASKLSVSQATVTAGQNVTVSGTVYSTANTVMAGASVSVTVDGVSAQTQTAGNGTFSVTVQPTAAVSQAAITVVANGATVSSPQFVLTVNPAAPYSITSSSTAVANVGPSQLSAVTYTVKDQYGNVVPNATVDFSLRQAVGTTSEAQAEVGESVGSLSVVQLPTGPNGQVTVDYTSSSTADNDNDVVDSIVATVAGTNVTNTQAQFAY